MQFSLDIRNCTNHKNEIFLLGERRTALHRFSSFLMPLCFQCWGQNVELSYKGLVGLCCARRLYFKETEIAQTGMQEGGTDHTDK